MNSWLRNHLICPRDGGVLETDGAQLVCAAGHNYPIFDGIPIMLVDDIEFTHDYIRRTIEQVTGAGPGHERQFDGSTRNGIDEFVQGEVPYTSGNLYFSVQNRLKRYPIPKTRLRKGNGERLLDIGCNWGRWSIAAFQAGYKPVGIDPSIEAVLAARRVCAQLGVTADFVVGDARFLPFADDAFETVFSYSVFQHFSKENARISLREASRVLEPEGTSLVQMPNRYGIRQYQQHRRRGFTEGTGFEVRYWTPAELRETFEAIFGPTQMSTDCFFGLGIQANDVDMLPAHFKLVVYASEVLRRTSGVVKPLIKVADSVYLESVNKKKYRVQQ